MSQIFAADLNSENLKQRSVRGGVVTMFAATIETILRIGSIAILARLLIPEHFGLVSMVTAITTIAERFKDLGLAMATVQQRSITHEQVSKLFWINVATGFGIMVLVSAGSPLIAWFFHDPRLTYITIAISSGFFWGGLTIQHQALLRRQTRFTALGVIQIVATALSVAVAVVLAVKGSSYWALVWREVLRNVFLALGTWIACPWLPGRPKKHIKIDHMLRFGGDLTGFNLIIFLTANLDQILIGKFAGAVPLGIYRQAYQLVFQPIMQFSFALNYVAESTLSILQDEKERYRKYYRRILEALNFVTMPVLSFCAFYAPKIVASVLGKQWMAAADIFRILAISALIKPAADSTGYLLVTCGQTKRYFNLALACAPILLLSVSVGVFWGALGVAYGQLVAAYIVLVLKLFYSFEGTPVSARTFLKATEKPLVASGAMMIALIIFTQLVSPANSSRSLILAVPVAATTYVLTWMVIPGGKEHLTEMIYDLMISLRLVKGLESGRKQVKFA